MSREFAIPPGQTKRKTSQIILRHLLEHVHEDRVPVAVCLGRRAHKIKALRRVAREMGFEVLECRAPDCVDYDHVTLVTEPLVTL